MQPREVAVALAARAALRVLPFVQEALRYRPKYIVLPVFRALAFAWAAARYSISTKGTAPPIDLAHFSPTPNAASNAATAAQAARAAVSNPSLAPEVFRCADDTVTSDSVAATKRAFWSAVSLDVTYLEEDGDTASVIAGSPLWPQGQPDQLQSLWQEMKVALDAEKQDWQVWTIWYDDRLTRRVNDEERELTYVQIDEALWSQGPAIVNAEIKKRIEEPPQPGVVELQAHSGARVSAGGSR